MRELGLEYYSSKEYRELFNTMIDMNICEDIAIGITNDCKLLVSRSGYFGRKGLNINNIFKESAF